MVVHPQRVHLDGDEQNSAYAGRNRKPSAAIPAQESPPYLFHPNLLLEPGLK